MEIVKRRDRWGGAGGAIAVSGRMDMIRTAISNSTAAVSGGGVFIDAGASAHVDASSLQFCSSAGDGGAIDVQTGATLTLVNSVLRNNYATHGGSLAVHFALAEVDGCMFENTPLFWSQSVQRIRFGGAVYLSGLNPTNDMPTTLRNSEIRLQQAQAGGAVYATETRLAVVNVSIFDSSASEFGGCLFLQVRFCRYVLAVTHEFVVRRTQRQQSLCMRRS